MSDVGDLTGPGDPDDDAASAGEYVLSLLPPRERAAFERRLLGEPSLRALVAQWEGILVELIEAAPPVRPSAQVRRAVMAELFPSRRPGPLGVLAGLVSGAAIALAGLLALDTVVVPARVPVEIAAADGSFVVAGSLDARRDAFDLQLVAGEPSPDRVLQLWVLPDDGVVRSLGILPQDIAPGDVVTVPVDDAVAPLVPGSFVEITEEPVGGSPGPGPTGPLQGVGTVPGR